MLLIVVSFSLLLSLFNLAKSQQYYPKSLPSLPYLSSRPAYPRDVVGNWTFIYSENNTLCPRSIQHLGFSRRKNGPLRIFHHRIIQDNTRCKNMREFKGRRFRLFSSRSVRAAFRNRTITYRIPPRLLRFLNSSIPIRRAFRAANKLGEAYFIGFEGRSRVCDGKRVFKKGTTAFLIRPTKKVLSIRGIGSPLTPGKRYMIMIPRFKRISCVYSSELRGAELAASGDTEEVGKPPSEETGNELEGKGDSGSCFAAAALTRLADGRTVLMKDLSVRDSVQVGTNQYSSVFMFTHRSRIRRSIFRRIELQSGETLEVTGGHYIYANGKLITASEVRIGDMMPIANGTYASVTALNDVEGLGLFNPQTIQGDIIVNGVRVSTYTRKVEPRAAHALLAPLRAMSQFLNMDLSFGLLEGEPRILSLKTRFLR